MREGEKAYAMHVNHDGLWLGVTVQVLSVETCGPWHQEGCDSALIIARLMKLVRGLTGITRAACLGNEHLSLQLLLCFTEETEVTDVANKIDDLVAGMFEYAG